MVNVTIYILITTQVTTRIVKQYTEVLHIGSSERHPNSRFIYKVL